MPNSRIKERCAAIYARVSTSRQAEHDLSIPDQIKQGKAYCAQHGLEVVRTFVEAGASATDDRRPVFQKMMDEATSANPPPFDTVVVHSQSRFFRDHLQFGLYERSLKRSGVSLVSITQDFGTDSSGQLARQIASLFDEHSSRENAKHTHRAMRENAKQGFWNGSIPPFGYKTRDAERRGDKIKKVLQIDPAEAAIVRRIYDLYLGMQGQAVGIKEIASRLNREGVQHRGKRFSTANVHRVLSQDTYRGLHYFDRKDSRTGKWKDSSVWVQLQVPAIIDDGVFARVQAIKEAKRPTNTPPRISNGPTLLAGLAKCGTCGGGMVIRTGKGGQYRYYTCAKAATQGKQDCGGRSVPMPLLDNLILDHLIERLFTPERMKKLLGAYLDRSIEAETGRRREVSRLKAEVTELQGRKEKLLQLIETGVLTPDDPDLKRRITDLQLRRQETLERIGLLEQELGSKRRDVTPEKVERFASAMREKLRNGTKEFRRAYLNLFIDKIDVGDTVIQITGPKAALAKASAEPVPAPAALVPSFVQEWRARRDSNSRPLAPEASALSN